MEIAPIMPNSPLWKTASISPLWESDLFDTGTATPVPAAGTSLFGDIFRSAIENVRETDAVKTDLQYRLVVGELDNPAELSIASSKAGMAADLLIQLRNKALEAYSELNRINL